MFLLLGIEAGRPTNPYHQKFARETSELREQWNGKRRYRLRSKSYLFALDAFAHSRICDAWSGQTEIEFGLTG